LIYFWILTDKKILIFFSCPTTAAVHSSRMTNNAAA